LGQSPHRPIRGDLIMLDALCSADQCRVLDARRAFLFEQVRTFFDESFHRLASFRPGGLPKQSENFFKSLDMALGLFKMFFKSGTERLAARPLSHLWKRLHELLFRAQQFLQFVDKQVFQRIKLHRLRSKLKVSSYWW